MSSIKDKAERVMAYLSKHMTELSVIGFFSLFVSWHIGFYANGLYGCRFELSSVWQGISTLFGAGVFASIKYVTDSWKNSDQGQNPYAKGAKTDERNDINRNI